jgi:hypothetical protein
VNFTSAIESYLDALNNARLAFRSPSVALPFLAFGLLQCCLLSLLAFFTWPPAAWAMIPVVRALGGEPALHYPTHFVLLPSMYRMVYLPLVATVGFAAWSFGIWSMVAHHEVGMRVPARSFRAALPAILVVGVVYVAVTVALGQGLGALAATTLEGIPARLATLVAIAAIAASQAFLLYAPIVLRLQGGGPLRALRNSARYARRYFGATAMLVATVLLAHVPLDALIGKSDAIAARFHPEVVLQLLIASVLLEVVTAFVLFAGIVALALPEEGGLR